MDQAKTLPPQRVLDMLERLLQLPAADLKATLVQVCDLLADASGADKVDAFLYDPARDSLAALGSSTQPLSALQRSLGLDVLQLSNGGRGAQVFQSGRTYVHGRVDEDTEELRGIRDALGVRSEVGVPLDVGGRRRGMLMLASREWEYFSAEDVRFVESIASWVGIVAHRAELVEEIGRAAVAAGRRAGAEELITVLAHDLRNYLAPLGLRLELLRVRAEGESRTEDLEDAAVALNSLRQLSGLVSDILDMARLDQGLFQLRLDTVDIGRMAADAAGAFGTALHPVRVTVQQGERLAVVADRTRLRQCIDNIIANAVQKSPEGTPVTVLVKREARGSDAGRVIVEVLDEGPGIPQELLPHVFEPFVTGRREGSGLGLGLYLARRIAALHAGELGVESTPGKGARFRLSLPAPAA